MRANPQLARLVEAKETDSVGEGDEEHVDGNLSGEEHVLDGGDVREEAEGALGQRRVPGAQISEGGGAHMPMQSEMAIAGKRYQLPVFCPNGDWVKMERRRVRVERRLAHCMTIKLRRWTVSDSVTNRE